MGKSTPGAAKKHLADGVKAALAVFHVKEAKAEIVFCNELGIHVKFDHGKEVLLACGGRGYGVICGPDRIIDRFGFWHNSKHGALCHAARQMWHREMARRHRAAERAQKREARKAARAGNHRPAQMSLKL